MMDADRHSYPNHGRENSLTGRYYRKDARDPSAPCSG
jgi:hypothetical protein